MVRQSLVPWLLMFAAGTLATTPRSQAIHDVGVRVSTTFATVSQACSQFRCTPFSVDVNAGSVVTVDAFAAPGTLFAVIVGVPGTSCQMIPEIGNGLAMDQPVAVAHVGETGRRIPGSLCGQGSGQVALFFPFTLPPGVALNIQVLGRSSSRPRTAAFSNPVNLSVRTISQ